MTKVVVYNENDGSVSLIMPTPDCLQERSIYEIAVKDVPAGKRFKIVDVAALPQDIPQEAWVIDEADLTDGVGGTSNEFD